MIEIPRKPQSPADLTAGTGSARDKQQPLQKLRLTPERNRPELEQQVTELLLNLNASNAMWRFTFDIGLSNAAASVFEERPENKPYNTVELPADLSERRTQYVEFGKTLRKADITADTQCEFLEHTILNLFQNDIKNVRDQAMGIIPESRETGPILHNQKYLLRMEEVAREISRETETDGQALYDSMMSLTENGNFAVVLPLLQNYNLPDPERMALQRLYEQQIADENVAVAKFQLGMKIYSYIRDMGIDVDELYRLKGFPSINDAATLQYYTENFLKGTDDAENVRELVHAQAPAAEIETDNWQKELSYWSIYHARAVQKELPQIPMTPEQVDAYAHTVRQFVATYLPLAFQTDGRRIVQDVKGIGSNPRAASYAYRHEDGGYRYLIPLNPRTVLAYPRIVGHEGGHGTHDGALEQGINAGQLPAGIIEKYPEAQQEEVADMIGEQMHRMYFNEPEPQPQKNDAAGSLPNSRRWGEIGFATLMRRQGPMTLVQIAARREIETLYNQGIRELSIEEARALNTRLKDTADAAYRMGINMATPFNAAPAYDFIPEDAFDGPVYITQYFPVQGGHEEGGSEEKKQPLTLTQAFEQTGGWRWLEQDEHYARLFRFLIETGDTKTLSPEKYAEYVLRLTSEDARQQLSEMNIDPSRPDRN